MARAKPNYVVAKLFKFDPDTEQDVTLFIVPEGKLLKTAVIKLYFDIGTEFQLKCKVKYGEMPIKPDNGEFTGNGNWVEAKFEMELESGSKILLHAKNESTTEIKKVYVIVEGEVE